MVILPSKMPAIVGVERLKLVTPLRLYTIATPPTVIGIVSAVLPHPAFAAVCSVSFIVTSEPAKSAVPLPIAVIPAPDPVP